MNLTKVILNREINCTRPHHRPKDDILNYVYTNFEYFPAQRYSFHSTINHLTLDNTNVFMLVSEASGTIHVYEVTNNMDGHLEFVTRKELLSIMILRSQWLPNDNGMLAITQPKLISLINSNTFQVVDSYKLESNPITYWSDWNANDINLIAVALSNSCVRLIDIRAGNSVHTITTKSPVESKGHNITRILWAPFDKECFFAGDSSGYIHLYDIRRSKHALQIVGEDYTTCEAICSMDYNPKKTSLIISQGRVNPSTTMWSFKRKKLRNTNVNFSANREARNRNTNDDKFAFIKYQPYVTDRFLFKPIINNFREVSIFDLLSGRHLNTFATQDFEPNRLCDAACVLGLYDDYNILYSASRNSIKVWSRKVVSDIQKEEINRFHQDDWSD